MKTSYSFRRSFGMPKDIVPIIKELGYKKAIISDFDSTFGWYKWNKICKDNEIAPVFGVTINVTSNIQAKKPVVDAWTFLAIDDIKYVNELVRLSTDQFRYTGLLTYDQALEAKGVIKIAGHRSQVEFLRPVENLYIGLTPAVSKGYIKSLDNKYEFVQWQVNAYPKLEDELDAEITIGRNFSLQTFPQHILSIDEWKNAVDAKGVDSLIIESAVQNYDNILDRCNASIKKADLIRINPDKTLEEMCRIGAVKLNIDLNDPVYEDRLQTELKVIRDKKFEDYFYFVADLIQSMNETQLIGPGRGSSAGSLVCYLLGITRVDPIKYNLLFFRFLDPGRSDWPDIDVDFSDRDSAIEFLGKRYGKDRVAKLGTTGNWQTQNASNELSKALQVSKFEIQPIIDTLPKYAANDDRNETALAKSFELMPNGKNFIAKYPEFKVVTRMIGLPSNAGVHASGVVLTNEPLDEFVSVDSRPTKQVAMIDLHEAEAIGLIKMDVLGLKTLSILESTLKIAGLPRDTLFDINLNDQKVFDTMNQGKYLGIFQFDGRALMQLASTAKITEFEDFSVLSALSRPGASDGADAWVRRKEGKEQVVHYHELIKPFFEETLGVITYQEQIMLIAHDLAGMDWGSVTKLRKAIGKSQGDEAMRPFSEPFITGLVAAGVDQETAERLWKDILRSGSYLFNKSHSIAYGLVSYWTAWAKTYHPVEFAAATLTMESDADKQLEILRELHKEGVDYIPIDLDNSTDKWRVVNNKLVGPLTLIEGVGPKIVQQVLAARSRNEPLPDAVAKRLSNPKTKIDSLFPVRDAISKIDLKEQNIVSVPFKSSEIVPDGTWQDSVVYIGVVKVCLERSENEEKRIQDRIARGQEGFINGQDKYVELRLADDDGEILCKIGRKEFEQLSPLVLGKVTDDKTLVVVSGTVPPEIPMLLVKRLKIIGEL